MCLNNASNSLLDMDANVALAELPLFSLDGVDDDMIQARFYAQWQDGASKTLMLVDELGDDG